ncbi:MAG: class I SAM-dependent methyltransferase [Firmicutes bacterium]|nr:class I SAM-dependent methyltransferase [Bacillota bacterium]
MGFKTNILKSTNKLFPLPTHPFNLQNEGKKTYARWQYEKGEDTIKFFLDSVNIKEMFYNKEVLDIGCGAAGKTLYYASNNAKKVYGVDVVDGYKKEANKLAEDLGLEERFEFLLEDAKEMSFDDNSFDVIIINDAMEHVDFPKEVLDECYRVLKPEGKIFLNFPPYYHPFGAHLSDVIGIPWVHLFFNDDTLIKGYKDLVKNLPDGDKRIKFRISKDNKGNEYFSYINKMTIKRFNNILPKTDFKIRYYKEVPLRNFFKPLTLIPGIKEAFVKMVVVILEK